MPEEPAAALGAGGPASNTPPPPTPTAEPSAINPLPQNHPHHDSYDRYLKAFYGKKPPSKPAKTTRTPTGQTILAPTVIREVAPGAAVPATPPPASTAKPGGEKIDIKNVSGGKKIGPNAIELTGKTKFKIPAPLSSEEFIDAISKRQISPEDLAAEQLAEPEVAPPEQPGELAPVPEPAAKPTSAKPAPPSVEPPKPAAETPAAETDQTPIASNAPSATAKQPTPSAEPTPEETPAAETPPAPAPAVSEPAPASANDELPPGQSQTSAAGGQPTAPAEKPESAPPPSAEPTPEETPAAETPAAPAPAVSEPAPASANDELPPGQSQTSAAGGQPAAPAEKPTDTPTPDAPATGPTGGAPPTLSPAEQKAAAPTLDAAKQRTAQDAKTAPTGAPLPAGPMGAGAEDSASAPATGGKILPFQPPKTKSLGAPLHQAAVSAINRAGAPIQSIRNWREIRQIDKKIQEAEKKIRGLQRGLKPKTQELDALKRRRLALLLAHMFTMLVASIYEGYGSGLTVIGILAAIFWFWSFNLIRIVINHLIRNKGGFAVKKISDEIKAKEAEIAGVTADITTYQKRIKELNQSKVRLKQIIPTNDNAAPAGGENNGQTPAGGQAPPSQAIPGNEGLERAAA